MINYSLGWPCDCCDDWKDSSENYIVLRNGQRICRQCYNRKQRTQLILSAKRKKLGTPTLPLRATQTVPY
ncbi:MAG: hypothetical protein HC786_02290 [Richelia sp. CSU_2_1]|nr:hypothetical protein [Microcoleus sp. SU_5_6]NJR21077.1 hypothetical protein [Richelia sp. CSU_2_1]